MILGFQRFNLVRPRLECGFICHDRCKSTTTCNNRYPSSPDEPDNSRRRPISEPSQIKNSNKPPSTSSRITTNENRKSDPRPTPSVSFQLRERTRKLSRVFTPSSSGSNNNSGRLQQPHSTRSHDMLRFIREDEVLDLASESLQQEEIRSSTSASYVDPKKKQQSRRRRTSNPDDCIIS